MMSKSKVEEALPQRTEKVSTKWSEKVLIISSLDLSFSFLCG